jgi:hypothetical protein
MSGNKTAKLLAECGRQHGNGTLHEINAGCSFPGVAVQGSVWFHEVRNVRNMHANVIGAVFI